MDYTKKKLSFKIKKALRYIKLYGIRRTARKIRSQYHMKKRYSVLPAYSAKKSEKHVAIVGCGNFAFSTVAHYIKKNYGEVIRACCDVDINRAASLFEVYDLDYYSDNIDGILEDPQINLVYIVSNHATHAEYAIEALKKGKHVHIEKPHVVNLNQLTRLVRAIEESKGRVSLGFNRPHSVLGRKIKSCLDQEPGPGMYNWFIAGHAIDPDHWYFAEAEGGRILGNLCHWTDYIFTLVADEDRYPITITPTRHIKSDSDIAVTYLFGDGTIGIITFSAKGHTFEGVRERFSGHKGNSLIAMDDFSDLVIECGDQKSKWKLRHRDHGHERSIVFSYEMSIAKNEGRSASYIAETAMLFLKTKEALDKNEEVTIKPTLSL